MRRVLTVITAASLLGSGFAAIEVTPAGAVKPWDNGQKVHWYPSRITMRTDVGGGICFSGVISDRAGFDKHDNVTGRIWQHSFYRSVQVQRKDGKKWVKIWGNRSSDNRKGDNYGLCIDYKDERAGAKYRVYSGTYYPYNTASIRARRVTSKVFTLHDKR